VNITCQFIKIVQGIYEIPDKRTQHMDSPKNIPSPPTLSGGKGIKQAYQKAD